MNTGYKHADIKRNKEALDKIANLEKDLSEILKQKIVLIAYTE